MLTSMLTTPTSQGYQGQGGKKKKGGSQRR